MIVSQVRISIHALLAESDKAVVWQCASRLHFYPRSPCGERPRTGLTCGGGRNISIHALLAESDVGLPVAGRIAHRISIHALLAESDRYVSHMGSFAKISIHALLAESDLSR